MIKIYPMMPWGNPYRKGQGFGFDRQTASKLKVFWMRWKGQEEAKIFLFIGAILEEAVYTAYDFATQEM